MAQKFPPIYIEKFDNKNNDDRKELLKSLISILADVFTNDKIKVDIEIKDLNQSWFNPSNPQFELIKEVYQIIIKQKN